MRLGIAGIFMYLAVCCTSVARAQQPAPDRIFHGGTVLTMAEDGRIVEAIAIHADSILAVGSDEEVLGLSGPSTLLIDLAGRTLIPGFVDAHSHLFSEAEGRGMTPTDVQGIAFRNGVTTLANLYTTRELVDELKSFQAEGRLRLRTSLYLSRTNYCGEDLGEWYLDFPPTRDRRGPLRIGGVKVFTDGGTCGQPATSFRSRGQFGNLWRTQQEFEQLISEVDASGYQLAIHAVGDVAVHQALDGLEAILDGRPNTLRHRIEHNSLIAPEDLPRYGQLGVPAVIFGTIATCAEARFGALSNIYGDNVHRLEDWRSLLDANPNLAGGWHSDSPFLILDPIKHLFSYVTRIEFDGEGHACHPPPWLAEHAITSDEAIELMTLGAAKALDWDDHVGSLEPGKLADMVVLSQDPTSVDDTAIIDTEILATYVGGSLAYCAAGSEVVCGLAVAAEREVPDEVGPTIQAVYPNPIRSSARIVLRTDEVGKVELAIYDVEGRRIATLLSADLAPGSHHVQWSVGEQPAGVYFIRLATEHGIESRKLVLMR